MKKEVRHRIRTYIRNRRKQNRFFAVLSVLSLVVALSTFYALSLPALTLDNDAVGSGYGEEVAADNANASPTPAAAPSASQNNSAAEASSAPEVSTGLSASASPEPASSESPEVSVGTSPSPSASTVDSEAQPTQSAPAPSASPGASLLPGASPSPSASALPSVSPSPSPSPSPELEAGMQYTCEAYGLTVSVTLDMATEIPEDAELNVIRVTGGNSAANGTVNINGIESDLGVANKGNFEYYLLNFIVDGEIVAMPKEPKIVSITDTTVGKKYGARAIYGVGNKNGSSTIFEISDKNITTEKQTVSLTTGNTFSGLVVYWYKGVTTNTVAKTTSFASATVKSNGQGNGGSNGSENGNSGKTNSQTHYEYTKDSLTVSAELSDPNAISDEASLVAYRITNGDDFWTYLRIYLRLYLNGYIRSDDEFYFYDIHFELNGQEVEPSSGTVSVTLQDDAYSGGTINTYDALHIDNGNNISRLKLEPQGLKDHKKVKFSVDSFSPFIILPSGSRLSFDLVEEQSDTFTFSPFYNPTRPLGMAGNFHIVAFDTAYLNAHTNGNVLAQTCYASSNFGTNNLPEEVSYIQNYAQVSPTSASSTDHILALGSSNVITLMDNGNAFGVNGTKLDKPYNILQDDDTSVLQFVNMNLVESEFRSIILSFGSLSDDNIDSSNLNIGGGSCNASYIELTDSDALGVFNITASDLNQYSYLGVRGFVSGDDGTVIINVDCTGYTGTVNIPNSEMAVDNNWLGFQERTNFIYGRILWNFINCTSDIGTGRVYGTIVAPDSTIRLYQNVNGTVVGNNVYIYAESHRDDFIGKLSNGISVNKIWLDTDDSTLPASEVDDFTVVMQPYWSNNNGATWHHNTADQFELNSANSWTHTWFQPSNQNYLWKVEEVEILDSLGNDVSSNYTVSYSSNNDDGITQGLIYTYNKITYRLPDTGGVTKRPLVLWGVLMIGAAMLLSLLLKLRQRKQSLVDSG